MERKRKRKIKQKKKSKKWLYVLLTFVLIILGFGGYILYEFKFKEYDVADSAVDEIVEDTYVLQLPDGTEVVVDKEGNIIEQKSTDGSSTVEGSQTNGTNTEAQESQNNQTTSEDQEDSSENPNISTVNSKPTVASIKDKYVPTLKALEVQATSKIDNLLSRAVSEYSTKKENGEDINPGYFYNKYAGAAERLESSTDSAFNSLIGIIEQDLEANGFDKSYAQSFRNEYEAAKKARRNAILSKAKEFM